VFRDALVDEGGNFYRENEIAALPYFRQQIAALRRGIEALAETGVTKSPDRLQFASALRQMISVGSSLLQQLESATPRGGDLEKKEPRMNRGSDSVA
jgi:hypothetical protein